MRRVVAPLAALLVVGVAVGRGDDGDDGRGGTEASWPEGVPWVLVEGVHVDGWEAVAPSAIFQGGMVGGSTGCNRYTASASLDGEELSLGPIASTLMACAPPADAVEREFVAVLQRVARWRSTPDELVLLDADGSQLLRFTAATPVGRWQATGLLRGDAFTSPIAGTELTATFGTDGTLSGSAGCNRYTSSFTGGRGELAIAPPAATRMACAAPDGVMEQEAAYLAALAAAAAYRGDGRSLELLRADGTRVVSFARV